MAKGIREDVGGESVVSTTEGVFHRGDVVGESAEVKTWSYNSEFAVKIPGGWEP